MRTIQLFLVFLVASLLVPGCADKKKGGGGNTPPVAVSESLNSVNLSGTTIVAQVTISNIGSQTVTLNQLNCVLHTTGSRPAGAAPIQGQYEMRFRSLSTNPVTFGVGQDFGLFFFQEKLGSGESLTAQISATISGCQSGEDLRFTINWLEAAGYDHLPVNLNVAVHCP